MTTTRTLATCVAVLTLAMAAGAAQAQAGKPGVQAQASDRADQLLPPAPPQTVNDGEAYHRADDAQQDPTELRTTQALNDEIASRNQLAENQEQADQAAFQAERAKYEETVTQANQDRLAYEEGVRQSETAQRRWEADRARWEADVAACQAGNRTRCAAPPR